MAMTLDLTDWNDTPSGVTAAVSGVAGSWTVYYTPADRPWPGDAWIVGGTGTGAGSVDIELPKRHYFFAGVPDAGAPTLPERLAVNDGLDALATRSRAATIAALKTLNLENIGDRVYDQMFPLPQQMKFPCIGVHVADMTEEQAPGTNLLDTIGYPVDISFYAVRPPLFVQGLPMYERWRQGVYRLFRDQHLQGVPESVYSRVVPQTVASSALIEQQFDKYVSSMRITNYVREPRGQGA
jgi:hypothetical protein